MGKRGVKNPKLGITDGKMRTLIKSALRKISRDTSRKVYINSVRFKHVDSNTGNMCWHVKCAECGKIMRETATAKRTKKDGTLEAKAKSVFEVNHINGVAPLDSLKETLGDHADDLFFGEQEILCVECHKAETARQTGERFKKEDGQADLFG